MKTKKPSDILPPIFPKGETWETIEKKTLEGKFDYLFNMMRPSTFEHVLEAKDRSKAITLVQKALKRTDPQNANLAYAEKKV